VEQPFRLKFEIFRAANIKISSGIHAVQGVILEKTAPRIFRASFSIFNNKAVDSSEIVYTVGQVASHPHSL
jgi:hypothetical protein